MAHRVVILASMYRYGDSDFKFIKHFTSDLNFWNVLGDASKAWALLHHCGCGKACRGNCKCARAGIKCTIMCNSEGGCINNDGV